MTTHEGLITHKCEVVSFSDGYKQKDNKIKIVIL